MHAVTQGFVLRLELVTDNLLFSLRSITEEPPEDGSFLGSVTCFPHRSSLPIPDDVIRVNTGDPCGELYRIRVEYFYVGAPAPASLEDLTVQIEAPPTSQDSAPATESA
jgi:hypothetical protein